MLTPRQQAFDLFNKSQNILVVLPQSVSADSLGAALGLEWLGKETGKNFEIVVQGQIPNKLMFLPGVEEIKKEPAVLRDFIILIDNSQKKIKQLRYESGDSTLKIFLAGAENLEEKDIRLEPGPFRYDLVVTLAVADLEALGQFYEKYAQLFMEKPVLNIDHRSGNEHFGEVNLVEPTASSVCEILTDFLNSFFTNNITPKIATCLLAGIIDETQSFQKINTTPLTFNLSSLLISRGAEKEKIIQALYKTKPFNFLKLWGRVLSRLEYDNQANLAWAQVRPEDLEETQSQAIELDAISDEINDLLPQLNASILLFAQETNLSMVFIQSERPELLKKLNMELGGAIKNHRLTFQIAGRDPESAKAVIGNLINPLI